MAIVVFVVVLDFGHGETENGRDARQLAELLAGHVHRGEDAHDAVVILDGFHQLHVASSFIHVGGSDTTKNKLWLTGKKSTRFTITKNQIFMPGGK